MGSYYGMDDLNLCGNEMKGVFKIKVFGYILV